jgi:hypothetical protein
VKVRTRKLAVFATCLGIAGAFPVLSSADKGGTPNVNSTKPCPGKGKGRSHKKPHPNNNGLNKGKKCGFAPISTTSTPSTTVPSTTAPTTTS